ncbi:Uncharacterised protein [Vibrio cholerae]|uniref:Uncharacterized protein n=1 Tax=Vibrio cholerae TaxID=666 RepID=A0A656AI42_VIBCL|nr:Uncharacterised protein [Vibrio cholerae]CSI15702.1 Uncharacterised protein [Vibrio cholerae]CSI65119.1 Uncharacterised protein [Vibrio cholerae]
MAFRKLDQRAVITFVIRPSIRLLDQILLTNFPSEIVIHQGLSITGKLFHRQYHRMAIFRHLLKQISLETVDTCVGMPFTDQDYVSVFDFSRQSL